MMEKYLKERSAINKTLKSHDRDREFAHHLSRFFRNLYPTQIIPERIYEYKVKRREESASPRTNNFKVALMSHAILIS
jgi:hypothetical protein